MALSRIPGFSSFKPTIPSAYKPGSRPFVGPNCSLCPTCKRWAFFHNIGNIQGNSATYTCDVGHRLPVASALECARPAPQALGLATLAHGTEPSLSSCQTQRRCWFGDPHPQ